MILGDELGVDMAGGMMKDTSDLWWQPNVGASNETGFAALPAGRYERHAGKEIFRKKGEKTYFWTTHFNEFEQWKVYTLYRYYNSLDMEEVSHLLSYPNAMSVRCIKDP